MNAQGPGGDLLGLTLDAKKDQCIDIVAALISQSKSNPFCSVGHWVEHGPFASTFPEFESWLWQIDTEFWSGQHRADDKSSIADANTAGLGGSLSPKHTGTMISARVNLGRGERRQEHGFGMRQALVRLAEFLCAEHLPGDLMQELTAAIDGVIDLLREPS